MHPRDLITERQIEILGLAGQGMSIRKIARVLGMTSTTCIDRQLKRAVFKLGASTVQDAVANALAYGLMEPR